MMVRFSPTLKRSRAPRQEGAQQATQAGTESPAAAAQATPGVIESGTFRDAARLAALQTELRLLGGLAADSTVEALQPYVAVGAPQVQVQTVVRSADDARFRMPQGRLRDILDQFDGDITRPAASASVLIVVAHQDDECVGAGAQLARLEDVTVLHATDGAPRNVEYARRFGFSTPDDYGEARRREAKDALSLVGIPEENQLCLGIPDGEAPYHLVDLSLSLAEVMDELRPEVVLTHPYEGGHTDHDAIAFAVHLACGILRREGTPIPAVLELTSYHQRDGRRVVHEFLPFPGGYSPKTVRLTREGAELKARMFERFVTQQRCLKQFVTDLERFRPAPRYNFTSPPHEGTLDYERLCRRMSGAEWREHAAKALERLRTRRRGRISLAATRTSSGLPTAFVNVDPES